MRFPSTLPVRDITGDTTLCSIEFACTVARAGPPPGAVFGRHPPAARTRPGRTSCPDAWRDQRAAATTYCRRVFCNRCGNRLRGSEARFCAACGAALDRRATSELDAVPLGTRPRDGVIAAAAAEDPSLVVRRGPNRGSRYRIGDGATRVGRDPDADLFLDDITVSRHHAVISRATDHCTVVDAGSLNGTYLNGVRIDGLARLRHGDELQIGLFKLVFVEADHAEVT